MQITSLNGLTQLIKEPTRVTEHSSTAIDLIFVNKPHRFISSGVQDFGASDHSLIYAIKKVGVSKSPAEIPEIRSFKRYNKVDFCKDVSKIPWNVLEIFDDINDAVRTWCSLFSDVANRHALIKK